MTPTLLSLLVGALGAGLVAALAVKLRAWPRRAELGNAMRQALAYPRARLWGSIAALVYLVVFSVWGGRGGRIHYFYEEWIFTFTAADVVVGLVTSLLTGLVVALLVQTVKQVGMFKARQSGVGVFGTLLALAASFCP